jgi:ribosomal protein L37AE/L43A
MNIYEISSNHICDKCKKEHANFAIETYNNFYWICRGCLEKSIELKIQQYKLNPLA